MEIYCVCKEHLSLHWWVVVNGHTNHTCIGHTDQTWISAFVHYKFSTLLTGSNYGGYTSMDIVLLWVEYTDIRI